MTTKTLSCATHGERQATYVCIHLIGDSVGLGFNCSLPDGENPFPDAWCDDCELIRIAHGEWNDESQKLAKISVLCSGCYERTRIRNTRTDISLNDLADLRWKCSSCEDWHSGPCLDFAYGSPHYWTHAHQQLNEQIEDLSGSRYPHSFLNDDYCAIESRYFFVRGIIELPIVGSDETLRWGVWGSVSRENFEKLLDTDNDPARTQLPAMFSWMSSRIPEYPDTLNLKMYAKIEKADSRPFFELELSDHPLAQEFHHGIGAGRVKEIMLGRVREARDQ